MSKWSFASERKCLSGVTVAESRSGGRNQGSKPQGWKESHGGELTDSNSIRATRLTVER